MNPVIFDFRLCLNPECGLRYPVLRGNKAGERCPICLGNTMVVAERRSERESNVPRTKVRAAKPLQAVLDNVRSALNVGSVFRSAEAYGFGHLYMCGITPTPQSPEVRKTALGAEGIVPWSAHKDAVQLTTSLKEAGYGIWALERTTTSRALEAVLAAEDELTNLVLVVGNEQAGVDPGILELGAQVVHLEMRGRKSSFNVAVAFAIAAHVLGKAQSQAPPLQRAGRR